MAPVCVAGSKSERLVVKSTFLDFDDGYKHRQLFRSLSDSSLCKTTSLPEYHPGSSRPSSTNLGSALASLQFSEGISSSNEADISTSASRPPPPRLDSRPSSPDLSKHLFPSSGTDISTAASRSPSPSLASRPSSTDLSDDLTASSGAGRSTASSAPGRGGGAGRQRDHGHQHSRTTLMLRNLPNNYTRTMLLNMLDRQGLAGTYDFLYLPMDFDRGCSLGYAFVNLVDAALMPKFSAALDGFSRWAVRSQKVCRVVWSEREQGVNANVRRYQNSSVMHQDVPDEYRPCLFSGGRRVPFPAPRKRVARPATHRG